jgi:hypothetical protein
MRLRLARRRPLRSSPECSPEVRQALTAVGPFPPTAVPITYDFTGPTSGTNIDLGQSYTYAARQAAVAAAVSLPGRMARSIGAERRLSGWISPICLRLTAISRSTRTLRRTGSFWEFFTSNSATSLGTKIADITSAQNNVSITPTGDFLYFVSDSSWGGANVLLHSLTVTPDPVPEPASLALLAAALFGAGFLRRRGRPVLAR